MGKHASAHLQAAWKKHGDGNFTFSKLLVCGVDSVLFYEQLVIDGYSATNPDHGYNKRTVAQSNAGMKHSDETKRRVSAGMIGREVSPDTRIKISKSKLGMPHSDGSKKKMSAARAGRKLSASQVGQRGSLTPSMVAEIRDLYSSTDATQTELAGMFSISRESVGELLRGETWLYPEAGASNLPSSEKLKERHARAIPRGERHHNFGKDWGAAGRMVAAKINRRPLSAEQKIKIAEAKVGKKMPDSFREKMRITRLGKTMSEETLKKRSEALKNMSQKKANSIRAAYISGVKLTSKLAETFGVSKRCVRSVIAGHTWVESLAT